MRVLRGREETIEADRALVEEMRTHAAETGEPAVRVWRPHRQVAFGRRDCSEPGIDRARRIARTRGYRPVGRSVGGRAVAYTGDTVAFCRAEPVEDPREGLQDRYDRTLAALREALEAVGVDPTRGEPADAFCPGSHSLSADCGKLAGVAQRVTSDAALVGGVLVPRDRWEIAEVLSPVYDALECSFDPATVGSVRAADGDAEPEALVGALERALVGQSAPIVEQD